MDDETILDDYLLTNDFSSGTREKYLGLVEEHLGPDKVEVYERVMVADADYLQTAYDEVTSAYGDRAGYLRDGLGLSDETIARLREKTAGMTASGRPATRATGHSSPGGRSPW